MANIWTISTQEAQAGRQLYLEDYPGLQTESFSANKTTKNVLSFFFFFNKEEPVSMKCKLDYSSDMSYQALNHPWSEPMFSNKSCSQSYTPVCKSKQDSARLKDQDGGQNKTLTSSNSAYKHTQWDSTQHVGWGRMDISQSPCVTDPPASTENLDRPSQPPASGWDA